MSKPPVSFSSFCDILQECLIHHRNLVRNVKLHTLDEKEQIQNEILREKFHSSKVAVLKAFASNQIQ